METSGNTGDRAQLDHKIVEGAPKRGLEYYIARFSAAATRYAGSSWAFSIALALVAIWAAFGPACRYSDTWQLVINTSTTVITFLMVFLIQRSQNKDAMAIQLKLNELVAAIKGASNRLINVEELSEAELDTLHKHYAKLVELSRTHGDLGESHSIDEAEERHREKQAQA